MSNSWQFQRWTFLQIMENCTKGQGQEEASHDVEVKIKRVPINTYSTETIAGSRKDDSFCIEPQSSPMEGCNVVISNSELKDGEKYE
eukprot:m.124415 g.124415  ORF g.124415 m.124415 type:complete len:87 (+) comp37847_c0_seq29:1522-1782(+)